MVPHLLSRDIHIPDDTPGLYATVGCHPTRSTQMAKGPEQYLKSLDDLISQHLEGPGRAVAVGECGLDYDRLFFADKETQKKAFRFVPVLLQNRPAHFNVEYSWNLPKSTIYPSSYMKGIAMPTL